MIDRIEKSACTSVMVGKKASLNDSTFIARNEDRLVAIYPKRFLIQPAVSGRKEVINQLITSLKCRYPNLVIGILQLQTSRWKTESMKKTA